MSQKYGLPGINFMFVCFKGGMGAGACPCPPFAFRKVLEFAESPKSIRKQKEAVGW
jgi:hypothetical protein